MLKQKKKLKGNKDKAEGRIKLQKGCNQYPQR